MARPADAEVVDTMNDITYGGVEQQMPSAADLRMASDQPIKDKFLKYTNGDRTSPRQVLINEMNRDPSKERYPGYDPSEMTMPPDAEIVTPQGNRPPDAEVIHAKPADAEVVKAPDWIPYLSDALASGMHSAAKNLAVVGDAAANLLYPGIQTNFIDKLPEADKPLVPPEQAANATLPQKIAGGVVGAAPVIGEAMLAGGPLGAAGVMGANAAISTGTGILDQGGSLGTATGAAVASGAINAVGVAPIVKANSLVSQMVWGGTTNPLIGLMDDLSSKHILENYGTEQDTKIGNQINPWDWEKRAVEVGVGIGMGAGFHLAGLPAEYKKNKLLNEMYDAMKDKENFSKWTADQVFKTDQIVGPLLGDHVTTTPEILGVADHNTALKKLLDPENIDNTKVSEVLDILSTHPDISEYHREYARVLQRRAADLGLDLSDIRGTIEPDHPMGNYDEHGDISTMRSDQLTNPTNILHEITHAVTAKAIDNFLLPDKSNFTERQKQIDDRVKDLNTVFERARELAFKNPELKARFDEAQSGLSISEKHNGQTYGFRNLHEFASEVMVRPEFQALLSKMKAVDSDGNPLPIAKASGSKIKNMWMAAKAALKSVLNPGGGVSPATPTLFDRAFDHVTNLTDTLTASERTTNERSAGRSGDRAWLREDAKEKLSDANQAYVMGRIAQLLHDSASKGEFLTRLGIEMSNPAWKDFVQRRGEALWNQGEHVINTVKGDSFKNLPENTKVLTSDPRTVDQFFKDEFGEVPRPLTKGDDITPFGTAFLPATTLKIDKGANFMAGKLVDSVERGIAGRLINFVIDKARMYTSLGAKLHAEATSYYNEYHKLDRKGQENMMNEALYWDDAQQGRKQLIQLGMQWPTKEMLVHRGLTEAEANAYVEVTKGLDFLHTLLQQALIKTGSPPLDRIPGYMPHIFKGAYKVLVRAHEEATGKEFVVEVKGYQTKYGALNYIKQLNKGVHDVQGWKFTPEPDPQTGKNYRVQRINEVADSLMTSLQDHMTAYVNNSLLNPGIAEHLEKIDNASKRGFSKHIIERSDVAGYLGKSAMGENAGLNKGIFAKIGMSRTNNQIRELYDNYAKNVTEYYKNVMFMSEVAQPILNKTPEPHENGSTYGALLDHVTELQDYIQKFTYNFTGEGLNHLNRFIDKPARLLSESLGLSPTLYREAAGMLRNAFALLKLRANPGFYVGNALQWGHVITMLEMVNAMRTADGQKSPFVMASLAKALKEVTPGPELGAALEWARDNHVIDPQLESEMRRMKPANQAMDLLAKVTGGPLNPAIEGFSREVAFRIAYMHMREIHPGDVMKAREAAAQLMKMTMVDYDRSSRPLMFQQTGVLGEMISPFQVYRNAYLGNLEIMLRLAAEGVRSGKPALFLPLITSVSTFFMMAGAIGLPLAAEYNMIMNQLQKLMPDNADMFPTLQELLFKAHVPDWVTFGMLSSGTKNIEGLENGVYIGSSVNSVDTTQPIGTALFPFLDAIKDLSGVAGRAILHQMFPTIVAPATMSDVYAASKQVAPGVASHYIEKVIRPPNSDVAPKATTLEGSIRLEPSDVMAQNLGKQSLKVTKDTTITRLVDSQAKSMKETVKRYVQSAADIQMGYGIQGTTEEAERAVAQPPYSVSREEFYKMVADEVLSRALPMREKDARIQTKESFWKQQQRLEMER